MDFEKVVIVTQKTWLDQLIEEHNTKEQAKFYIEHMGGSFEDYFNSHYVYYNSLRHLKSVIPHQVKFQVVEKGFLPNFLFNPNDLIIVLGRDGLVINTAKYLENQIIVGVNPDPSRIDGVLLPFEVKDVEKQFKNLINNNEQITNVSMSKAEISTHQSIIGVNDLFIGHRSHQSARYQITIKGMTESHSSSGIIVSTGIGSTGWMRSILTGAMGIAGKLYDLEEFSEDGEFDVTSFKYPWNSNSLFFMVREPYPSKITGTQLVFGEIKQNEKLIVESNMSNGVIFSDGIEVDYLDFNSGVIAEIGIAKEKIHLLVN